MVWRLFATKLERADTPEAERPKLGAPSLYSVPPGVWEGIYVIEALMQAQFSVQADTVC